MIVFLVIFALGSFRIPSLINKVAFSLVERFASVPLLLALVAHLDLMLLQMDIKTAFLNGNHEENIYVD